MPINENVGVINSGGRVSAAGVAGVLAFIALSVLAVAAGMGKVPGVTADLWKVLVIGWVAFAAMAIGAALGGRADATNPQRLVWGYGLASGAMVASASMFLVPQAIGIGGEAGAPQLGGIGVAVGIVVGYSAHAIGHRLTHVDFSMDVTTAQISAHALSAGAIIGLVYGSMPTLGLLLGLAIVSHKGPAGYAAARRLRRNGKPVSALLLPAAGVGITAIPSAALPVPEAPVVNALVFGFAAGIFLHIAMDFLPNCEAGSEIDEVCSLHEESHDLLDRLRIHAVGSTLLGGVVVVAAWFAIAG